MLERRFVGPEWVQELCRRVASDATRQIDRWKTRVASYGTYLPKAQV